MTFSRLAPWLLGALLTATIVLWMTADVSPSAAADTSAETKALEQLSAIAAAHGHSIPDGLATYVHVGDTVLAHAPLDGITGYTDADFAKGVLVMAIVVSDARQGRVPNGAYVVQIKLDPRTGDGTATYFDAQGTPAASVPAHTRTPEQVNAVFAGAYDPPPPSNIPNVTSTHVFHNGRYMVDCAGWQPYRVIYY